MNVLAFLTDRCIEFDVIPHRDTFDAQRLAQSLHVSGVEVAKTVLLKADRGYAHIVAVLPANRKVDLAKVSVALGGSKIELANENDLKAHCPDCEFGALPPFGTHYAMKTLVDTSFAHDGEITFEANSHHEAIRMKFDDFLRLESPLAADITVGRTKPH